MGRMITFNVEQNSPEWLALRAGIPTASNFDKIITTKGLPSAQRQKYLYQLAGERLTGRPMNTFTNGDMERGKALEAEARLAYELMTNNTVEQVGFCMDDTRSFGCSPDGLTEDKISFAIGKISFNNSFGGVEIKCPTLSVAVEYLDKGVLPTAYYQQVQGQLLVTGRKWCDFVSYFPALPLLIVRVERDEKFIAALKKELKVFCAELNELTAKIGGRK